MESNLSRPPVPRSIENLPPPTPNAAPPAPAPPKRREIYRYTASRPLFACAWSCKTHPEKRWRLAVGSIVEDKGGHNRVSFFLV